MDVSKASLLKTTNFFCTVSSLRSCSIFPSQLRKNPLNRNNGLSIAFVKIPSWNSSAVSRRAVFQISSEFRRPSRRRNTLREKLVVSREDQVRKVPPLLNSDSKSEELNYAYHETENVGLHLDLDNKEVDETIGSKKLNLLGNSALWNKLENWVDQYKEDSEFWGIGTGPIFTVYQDSNGNITRVSVNEDGIAKRSLVRAWSFEQKEATEEFGDVNSKISRAKLIAKDIEAGEYTLPRNSSIAKFVTEGKKSSFIEGVWPVSFQRERLLQVFPQTAFTVFCAFFAFWATKKMFLGNKNVEYTRDEVEMLRRKKKSRMERGELVKGTVEVLKNESELPLESGTRPHLDKNELMKSIKQLKKSSESLVVSDSPSHFHVKDHDFDDKVREIREMARKARELERQGHSQNNKEGEGDDAGSILLTSKGQNDTIEHKSHVEPESVDGPNSKLNSFVDHGGNIEFSMDADNREMLTENNKDSVDRIPDGESLERSHTNRDTVTLNMDNCEMDMMRYLKKIPTGNDVDYTSLSSTSDNFRVDALRSGEEVGKKENESTISGEKESNNFSFDTSSAVSKKPKIIRSAKQARKYLAEKQGISTEKIQSQQQVESKRPSSASMPMNESTEFAEPLKLSPSQSVTVAKHSLGPYSDVHDISLLKQSHTNGASGKSWAEENFQQFDPIIKEIGVGFKQNYMVAKEKVQEESGLSAEISELGLMGEDEELEWMKDDRLGEIVLQVRENELAGRDPFHLMDADDRDAFFKGLERKAEKVNEKLLGLHEWVHSRIENLDYGADGISLDDPLEKIIPRWKGPAIDKHPEFLHKFTEVRKEIFGGYVGKSRIMKDDAQESLLKSDELSNSNGVSPYSPIDSRTSNGTSKTPKTLIECSDGSSRPGKKTGKEHWRHTKKWSQGFLQVYNAETDPEIKSIMKDMGKDLDRWITEKEIQDVADLMTKIPKKKRRYIEKKMNKLRREVETYGAPAVVSKYREYSDEKQEDYLWWLDLQFVLCIELYTVEDGAQKVGLYSLEMAADLELDPKQYHVIAFQDPGDSKNFCYIVQAHMDMLGAGRAFVVAQPPKDAFREAKANGFSVTVIRKGEVKLNVDQTLEEVEEEITEIGSKIYHDKIMRERGVDIHTLMKGVINADKSTKRSKQKRKRILRSPAKF